METMDRIPPLTPAESMTPEAKKTVGLPRQCRRLAWLSGILAAVVVGLSAWSLVQYTVRCATKDVNQ